MLSESTSAAAVALIAIGFGVAVDAGSVPATVPIDGTTVTGGGVGVALAIISRGAFKRIDEVITIAKAIANSWSAHIQRTENIHRVLTRMHLEAGTPIPSDSMDADTAPIEIDQDIFTP